jgi:hypothetical protein
VQYGFRALDIRPARTRTFRLAAALLVALSAVAFGTMSYVAAIAKPQSPDAGLAPRTRSPAATTSVLAGAPEVVAAAVARELFASAPVVVVAGPGRPADRAAATLAGRAAAPLLLTSGRAGTGAAALRAEINALAPRAVLAVGVAGTALSAQLPGIHVVTDPGALPSTKPAAPLGQVVLLLHQGDSGAARTAVAATARAAGVQVVTVNGYDPRGDPAAITALSAARPQHVLAIGARFGPAPRLAARVAVAVAGVQLPGGGQVLFPGHRLVALYGYPGVPVLGALGQQGLRASIARARKAAAPYRALSSVPVVPTFEIIASVAQGSPGRDGSYSYESSIASLRPWVNRATAAGMYVVLDLQAGRAGLLAQARKYRPLLKLPNVGLALDPEWKLQPGQLPLRQIGSVGITEVNSVSNWLARLTAHYRLPQKLLVLHQFRLSMILNERRLDTHHDDLAILIHMDGQGSQADKRQTWEAVIKAAPPGVHFGWKDFYTKDDPMQTPRQTMAHQPTPVMISYQ